MHWPFSRGTIALAENNSKKPEIVTLIFKPPSSRTVLVLLSGCYLSQPFPECLWSADVGIRFVRMYHQIQKVFQACTDAQGHSLSICVQLVWREYFYTMSVKNPYYDQVRQRPPGIQVRLVNEISAVMVLGSRIRLTVVSEWLPWKSRTPLRSNYTKRFLREFYTRCRCFRINVIFPDIKYV